MCLLALSEHSSDDLFERVHKKTNALNKGADRTKWNVEQLSVVGFAVSWILDLA